MVEGRHFVDFRLREVHRVSEGHDVLLGNMTVVILNAMQELDEQIAAARRGAKKLRDRIRGARIERPAFGMRRSLAPRA
jgi:hypothetical protein